MPEMCTKLEQARQEGKKIPREPCSSCLLTPINLIPLRSICENSQLFHRLKVGDERVPNRASILPNVKRDIVIEQ